MLATLKGFKSRPTSRQNRAWIFEVLPNIKNAKVLDLFAGTGSLGIEALSNGAGFSTLVEESSQVIPILINNVLSLGISEQCRVVRQEAMRYLYKTKENYDLIFADPPYAMIPSNKLVKEAIIKLNAGGFFILEDHSKSEETDILPLKEKKSGTTRLRIYSS